LMEIQFDRHRRLRQNPAIRNLVRENYIHVNDLIYPLFIMEGKGIRKEVSSMPGVYQLSIDQLQQEVEEITALGIQAIVLFGIPNEKDAEGTQAYADNGIVQLAIKEIKKLAPELLVIADTCLCEFTNHGHCGIIHEGKVLNDPSLDVLARTAISQARAGADIIAPFKYDGWLCCSDS